MRRSGTLVAPKRESRSTCEEVERLPVCHFAGDAGTDATIIVRTQHLIGRLWLSDSRAELIAGLAWENGK